MENQVQDQTAAVIKQKNTLGVVSLVLSIVAFAGCWIPILNIMSMIIAVVGICLGIWSFINVIRKKVKSIALPIIGIVLGVVAIIFSSTMNNAVSESISDSGTSSKVGTAESLSTQSENTEYNIGDIIAFDNKEVTVTKVDKNYTPKYSEAKSGEEFIKVTVKIENKSNSNISVNSFDFKIQDSSGAVEDIDSSTYSLDDQFKSADLISGGVRTGSVVFEVPKKDSNLKFIYQPSFWSDKKIQVKL